MKNYIFVLFAVTLFSCELFEDAAFIPSPTEMQVTVLYANNTPAADAEVRLYRNLSNLETRVGEVAVAKTNAQGIALFSALDPEIYYFYVSQQFSGKFFDNSTSDFTLGPPLVENALTHVSIKLKEGRPLKPQFCKFSRISFFQYNSENESDTTTLAAYITEDDTTKIIDSTGNFTYKANQLKTGSRSAFNIALSNFAEAPYKKIPKITLAALATKKYYLKIKEPKNKSKKSFLFRLNEAITKSMSQPSPYPRRIRIEEINANNFNLGNNKFVIDIVIEWE